MERWPNQIPRDEKTSDNNVLCAMHSRPIYPGMAGGAVTRAARKYRYLRVTSQACVRRKRAQQDAAITCGVADFHRNLDLRITLPLRIPGLTSGAQASSSQHLLIPANIQLFWQLRTKGKVREPLRADPRMWTREFCKPTHSGENQSQAEAQVRTMDRQPEPEGDH